MIGLITFHRALNVGAALQSYSLQEYISDNIEPCEIIDYSPNNSERISRTPIRWLLHWGRFLLSLPSSAYLWKKERKFQKFVERRYNLSSKHYYGDSEIIEDPPNYDIYISGSDQILNLTLSNNSLSYYLKFASNNKPKISYASSFGRIEISQKEKEAIIQYLPLFSFLSFREQSGSDIVKKMIGVDSPVVLDPVFLHERDYWSKIANETSNMTSPYIFVYSMEATPGLINALKIIRQEHDLRVITVVGGGGTDKSFGRIDKTCGPEEFLGYIKNATVVLTNSFHGAAFSTIFKKQAFIVSHSKRNARIENLLSMLKQKDKLIPYDKEVRDIKCLQFDQYSIPLESEIDCSKQYLLSSINYARDTQCQNPEQ